MDDGNQTQTTNPDNLPVIEENSLHRIVTTVKLYQEFNELGQEKFEEIYGKADPKSLEGVCYERYYKNYQKYGRTKPFELLKIPLLRGGNEVDGVDSLELGDYLKVDLDENKNVTKIESQKPFYWKEWSFKEDRVTSNYANFDFHIILPGITFGEIIQYQDCNVIQIGLGRCPFLYFPTKSNFKGNLSFYSSIFENKVTFANSTFHGKVVFKDVIFKNDTSFINNSFKEEANFSSSVFKANAKFGGPAFPVIFQKTANFNNTQFFEKVVFESVTFKDSNFFKSIFHSNTSFEDIYFEERPFFEHINFKQQVRFDNSIYKQGANFNGAQFEDSVFFTDGYENESSTNGILCFDNVEISNIYIYPNDYFIFDSCFLDIDSNRTAYKNLKNIFAQQSNLEAERYFYQKEREMGTLILREEFLENWSNFIQTQNALAVTNMVSLVWLPFLITALFITFSVRIKNFFDGFLPSFLPTKLKKIFSSIFDFIIKIRSFIFNKKRQIGWIFSFFVLTLTCWFILETRYEIGLLFVSGGEYVFDYLAGLTTGYGEKFMNTVGTIFVIQLLAVFSYFIMSQVNKSVVYKDEKTGQKKKLNFWDSVIFTFGTMIAQIPEDYEVENRPAKFFVSLHTMISVILFGLLGFVLGNVIFTR